jgi:hypothetical protein
VEFHFSRQADLDLEEIASLSRATIQPEPSPLPKKFVGIVIG